MKDLLKLLLFALVSFAILSCGDDEPTFEEDLVSTWNLLSISATGCDDPSDDLDFDFGTSGCTPFMDTEICTNGTYTFTSSGTFRTGGSISAGTDILQDLSGGGTYTIDGNTVTICNEEEDECESAAVTITDDTMTVKLTSEDNCSVTQVYFR